MIPRRSPRLHPLRRSPRLAEKAAKAMVTTTVATTRRRPPVPRTSPALALALAPAPAPAPALVYETNRAENPPSITTEEEFNRFNDGLSDEDKELQACLLMWCITRSIPYTLDLFHDYKRNVEKVRAMGLF